MVKKGRIEEQNQMNKKIVNQGNKRLRHGERAMKLIRLK